MLLVSSEWEAEGAAEHHTGHRAAPQRRIKVPAGRAGTSGTSPKAGLESKMVRWGE